MDRCNNLKKKKSKLFRMDFIQEVEDYEEQEDGSLIAKIKLIPDPKRYETIKIKGETCFKDKYTNQVIPFSALSCMEEVDKLPIYYSPPKKKDIDSYLKEMSEELEQNWDNEYLLEDTREPLKEFLNINRGKDIQIVILYVDMEGSTRISAQVDPDTNSKIIKIFLMQMSNIIDNYRGYVLKFIGDCAIGIFPADINFTSMCDNAVKSAILMKTVIEDVINPMFNKKGLPQIGCHIGLDIGTVRIERFGAIDIAALDDLIGYPMNLTAKIQSKAGHNEILLGKYLYELIHCDLQKYCKKKNLGEEWKMQDPIDENIYEVYFIDEKLKNIADFDKELLHS